MTPVMNSTSSRRWARTLATAWSSVLSATTIASSAMTLVPGVPAILNGFKGEVDAIGPGLTYTTEIGKIPFILNARHYEEFNATHRFDNSVTLITGTFVL
jgi:hypothetical protein